MTVSAETPRGGKPLTADDGVQILADVAAHPRRDLIEALAAALHRRAVDDGTGGGMWWWLGEAYVLADLVPGLRLDGPPADEQRPAP